MLVDFNKNYLFLNEHCPCGLIFVNTHCNILSTVIKWLHTITQRIAVEMMPVLDYKCMIQWMKMCMNDKLCDPRLCFSFTPKHDWEWENLRKYIDQ